jgi:hypothetical protein
MPALSRIVVTSSIGAGKGHGWRCRGDDSQPFGIINRDYTPGERVSFRCYK